MSLSLDLLAENEEESEEKNENEEKEESESITSKESTKESSKEESVADEFEFDDEGYEERLSTSDDLEISPSKIVSIASGVVTEQHLRDIAHELGMIKLCWSDVPRIAYEDRVHYPLSYYQNSDKEKLLLWYAENFRQQFSYKYPHRRPLLVACENECGIQKMVCTTIRPTIMKFPEFQTWQGCANFVSEHLNYEVLENPVTLPYSLNSPLTVIRRQSGHCFEFATVLASFLIACGYDAYVAFGYATREVCLNDRTRMECPFLQDEPEVVKEEVKEVDSKYFLKQPAALESEFLKEMKNREIEKQKEVAKKYELAELEAIKDFEKPAADELRGWRLHAWIVVLPSKDVQETFFIESTTGEAKGVDDPNYHGIESIWNHLNYWALVQFYYKTENCTNISFDLNNPEIWERLLIGEPIKFRKFHKDLEPPELDVAMVKAEKHLDMPPSWVEPITISHWAYERRYPQAKKFIYYRKTVSEQYPSYSHSDGLLERVKYFEDYELHKVKEIREHFKNRTDRMYFLQRNMTDNSVVEKFSRGREDSLKEHHYYSMDSGIEVKFTLLFYEQARLDGLAKLVMDPLFMTMYFEKRPDFLYFVHVDFAERINQDQPLRVINKIIEKYHRNPEKEAANDVAVVEYNYEEKKILLKFHYEDGKITHGWREYQKPPFYERGAMVIFDPNLTRGYLTGPNEPEPKPLYLYRLEMEYFGKEIIAEQKIRERENELLFLLRLRSQELAAPRLFVSEFDIERNEEAKKSFRDREQQRKEMEERDLNLVCDFLAPYYAKYDFDPKGEIPAKQAITVIEECLQDWKNLLVARANDIQQQFEQTCQDFYDRNNWYEQNQTGITKEQEEEYFDYCKRNSIYLHILEVRLNRHKELAPRRFRAIDSYLKSDPRLVNAYRRHALRRKKKL